MTTELLSALGGGTVVFLFGLANRLLDNRQRAADRRHERERDETLARLDRRRDLLERKLSSLVDFVSAASFLTRELNGIGEVEDLDETEEWWGSVTEGYGKLVDTSTLTRLLGGEMVDDGIENVLDAAGHVVNLARLFTLGRTDDSRFENLPPKDVIEAMTLPLANAIQTFEVLARSELALESDWRQLRFADDSSASES